MRKSVAGRPESRVDHIEEIHLEWQKSDIFGARISLVYLLPLIFLYF
jgi:hypothetical protein